ncbi:hypothetical protein GCM10011418_46850 [Sphingobacterium alkalisoli]|nr:acyl carrier protein [Sphingobacterium alkalisoli]GGH32968.1 hypothetical protein GCM10011418_46850 [Sphingobacterium alkalisoli]
MEKKLFYIWIGIIFQFNLSAQSNSIVPVSPEAAALSKMINYPVNLNTGIPDISIPLHDIRAGKLVLPITLHYHAGGFRINERSTRSGMGWSLSSDLQITRSVNGLDDIKSYTGYIANSLVKSKDTLDIYQDNNAYPLYSVTPFPYRNQYDIAMGEKDGSPDKFNYKLLGKSGSFYFQKNSAGTGYTIVPVPYDDIKITWNHGQFKIVDTDGTTYFFGEVIPSTGWDIDMAVDLGFEVSGYSPNSVISAWKCKTIVDATGTSQMAFEYEKKAEAQLRSYQDKIEYYYNGQSPSSFRPYYRSDQSPINNANSFEHLQSLVDLWSVSTPKYKEYTATARRFHVPYVNSTTGQVTDKVYPITQGSNFTSSRIAGLSLKQITFNGGRVVFTGADKLSAITVYQGQTNQLKEVSFIQTYTTPAYMQEAKNINGFNFQGTLYLDELHISGQQNTAPETYKFQYLEKQCFGNHLKGHDIWGYRNAYTFEIPHPSAGTSAIPAHSLSQRYYFGSNYFRDNVVIDFGGNSSQEMPNEQYMKRGVLSRITYPTQGFTVFNFEANKYKEGSVARTSGGLRISSIQQFDAGGTTPVSRKHYKYGENEDGTGILANPPVSDIDAAGNITYAGFSYQQVMSYLTGPNDVPGNGTAPFYPIPINCYNRGCLSVVANETKTTYLPSSFLDFTYSNGAPIYYTNVSEYREASTQLQGKTVHMYYDPDAFHDFFSVVRWPESHIEGTNIPRLQSEGFIGLKKAEIQYKNVSGSLTPALKTEYSYKRYLRLQMVRVVYAFLRVEFNIIGGNFNSNGFELYNQAYSLWGDDPEDYYISGQYGIAVGKMLPSKTVETNYDGPVPVIRQSEYFYDNQQYTQPSRIQVTDSRGTKLQTGYKYAYDYSGSVYQQMVAKNIISPVIEERVSYVSPVREVSRTVNSWASFAVGSGILAPSVIERSDKGSALTPRYTYDLYDAKGNSLQVTQKFDTANGSSTVYLWGYGGQYPVAKVENATYSEVLAVVGQSGINNLGALNVLPGTINTTINTLRNHANMRKAQVSSYTYKPLIGMTSKTDARGITEYYEYDNSGRLSIMKDSEGNILKTYCYNYKGQQVDCFGYVPPVPGPYQGMVSRVNSVIAEKLAIDPLSIVGVNRLIEDLGADELDYIEIIMDIEEEFDIEIPDVDLASLLTVGDIYEYLVIRLHILTYQGMVSRVNSVIAEKLAIDPLSIVGVNRLIEDLGADELDYIEIIMDIEEEFDIEIPDVDLASLLTVGDIYEYLGNVLKIDL